MFRFSIRELLLVTLVVGLGVGWLVDHRAQVANSEEYTKAYEQWRQIAEAGEERHETILRSLGFSIEKNGDTTTVTLPDSFRPPAP